MRRPRYRKFDRCGMTVEVSHLRHLTACGACVETSHNSVCGSVFVFDYQRDTLGRLWMVADSAAFLGIDGNMRHLRASSFSILALLLWARMMMMQTRFGKAASFAAVIHIPLRFGADNLFGVYVRCPSFRLCVLLTHITV